MSFHIEETQSPYRTAAAYYNMEREKEREKKWVYIVFEAFNAKIFDCIPIFFFSFLLSVSLTAIYFLGLYTAVDGVLPRYLSRAAQQRYLLCPDDECIIQYVSLFLLE